MPVASKSESNSESVRPVYLGTNAVRTFFGGKSRMWIARKRKYDPRFPKPVYFGKLPHWRVDLLEKYASNAPTSPEPNAA